ncbi:MAG: type II toxin-antitoxin system RelE/ParE family toxin [Verrucomicrobiaceae bacterium]|nr:type II toxin-antitoxin system RelE/ParE family toxin [Verrucomicrobiaceae bacterium]
MTIRFESEALIEYEEAAQYAEDRFGCGQKLVAAMRAALVSIAKDPTRFQPVGGGIRIFRLKRYPYYLFYHLDEPALTVTIYAVAHHKRQQDYWRARLPE